MPISLISHALSLQLMLCNLIKFSYIACSRSLLFDLLYLDFDELLLRYLDDDLRSWHFISFFTLIFISISSNPIRQEIANRIVDLGVELEHPLFELITYLVDFGLRNLLFLLLLI